MNSLPQTVPRYWLADNAIATAIANGFCALFPRGEKFFIRSVRCYLDEIEDPHLRMRVRTFFKQEMDHASAHQRMNDLLRAQGFDIDRQLAAYDKVLRWCEARLPRSINLAGTAASEHFTAVFAAAAFAHRLFDATHPAIGTLLGWHAAEEIDHKAVAFDVLTLVAPSYFIRILGLAQALALDGMFSTWTTIALLRQDRIRMRRLLRELASMTRDPLALRVFVAGLCQYVRPGFHPRDNADDQLADWLAQNPEPR